MHYTIKRIRQTNIIKPLKNAKTWCKLQKKMDFEKGPPNLYGDNKEAGNAFGPYKIIAARTREKLKRQPPQLSLLVR